MNAVEEASGLISNKIGEIKTLFAIAKLEAKLAGLSVFPILINLSMVFVVLLTLWLTAMLSMGYFIMWLSNNLIVTLSSILIINFILLSLLLKYLLVNLRNMSFKKTRHYLGQHQ
jgi:hypothetical protein